MQHNLFTGKLAREIELSKSGDRSIARFTLIENEYAGREEGGDVRERTVSIPFVMFGPRADSLAENALVGDQLIITFRVQNDNWEKEGVKHYGFSFIAESFDFGAPGKLKREQRASGG